MVKENIYQKLLTVAKECPPVEAIDRKDGPFGGVSHDAVTQAVMPLFIKHGIFPVVSVVDHSHIGDLTTVHLKVSFVNVDSPEDRVEVSAWGTGKDSSDKGVGKAISYAYKYALLKTLGLSTREDPDLHDHKPSYESQPYTPPKGSVYESSYQDTMPPGMARNVGITEKQIKRLYAIMKSVGATKTGVEAYMQAKWGYTSFSNLSKKNYDDVCAMLEQKKKDDNADFIADVEAVFNDAPPPSDKDNPDKILADIPF